MRESVNLTLYNINIKMNDVKDIFLRTYAGSWMNST